MSSPSLALTTLQKQHPKIHPLLKRTPQKVLLESPKNFQIHSKYKSKTSTSNSTTPQRIQFFYTQRIRDILKIARTQDSFSQFSYVFTTNRPFQQAYFHANIKKLPSLSSLSLEIHQNNTPKMLFKTLSGLKNLTHLTIGLKSVLLQDPKIIRLLFKKLQTLKKLASLTISLGLCKDFRGPELETFSSNLALLPQLTSLKLILDRTIQFDDNSLIKLASDLEKLTRVAQVQIDFGDGKKIHGTTLLKLFTSFGTLKALSDLSVNLRSCQLVNENDREYLSESLLCLDVPSIRKLRLHFYQNFMKDSLVKISKVLKKFSSLEALSLNFSACSNINNEGLAELSSSLKELTSLSSLSVNFASSVNAEFLIRDIASALKSLNKLVYLKLDLQRKEKTTNDQVQLLFKNLQTLVCLKFLDLNLGFLYCLSDAAMETLSESIKELILLQNLTLNFTCTNVITSQGIVAVSNSIKDLKRLSLLYLNVAFNENIDERATNAIADALECLPDLYSVSLLVNRCGKLIEKESGLVSLFNAMVKMGNIRDVHLSLTQNEVNKQGIDDLEKRKNLSYYWL